MTVDRLKERAAIADQMFRYARATDWLETEQHREVFTATASSPPRTAGMSSASTAWSNG